MKKNLKNKLCISLTVKNHCLAIETSVWTQYVRNTCFVSYISEVVYA